MNLKGVNRLLPGLVRRVERVTGQELGNVTLERNRELQIAGAAGRVIGFNPRALRGMSRREVRGVLAHELGHVASLGTNASDKTVEAYGDAVRARLGLGTGAGYGSRIEDRMTGLGNQQFKRLSHALAGGEYRQGMVSQMANAGVKNNGPTVGNRNRNTTVNAASKAGPGTPPPVAPSSAMNYAAAAAASRMRLAAALGQLKQERGMVAAQYRVAKGQAFQQRVADTAAAEADALDRGGVGSSVDVQGRAAAVAAQGDAQVAARMDRNSAIMELRRQAMLAKNQYSSELQDLASQRAAEQLQISLAEYEANTLANTQQNYQAAYDRALQKLLAGRNAKRDRARLQRRGYQAAGDVADAAVGVVGGVVDGITGLFDWETGTGGGGSHK